MSSVCRVVDKSVEGQVGLLRPWYSWISMECSNTSTVASLMGFYAFIWDPGSFGGFCPLWCGKVDYVRWNPMYHRRRVALGWWVFNGIQVIEWIWIWSFSDLFIPMVVSRATLSIVLWRWWPSLWKHCHPKENYLKGSHGLWWFYIFLRPSRKLHEDGGVIGCGTAYKSLVNCYLAASAVILDELLGVLLCTFGLRIDVIPPLLWFWTTVGIRSSRGFGEVLVV